MSIKNRRRHPRAAARFTGNVVAERFTMPCIVEGLSEGGARLRGVVARPGDRIVVDIDIPPAQVQIVADVLRQDHDGVGVAFPDPSIEALLSVREAVAATLEQEPRGIVLIVDDDEVMRQTLAGDLRAMGVPTTTAASALEALDRLEDPDRDIELALIDCTLPGIDGGELCAFLASEYPQVRRVLMSSSASLHEMMNQSGDCEAYLQKPWRRLELLDVLAG